MYEPIEYLYNIEARIGVICDATAKSMLGHYKVIERLQNSFWGYVGWLGMSNWYQKNYQN